MADFDDGCTVEVVGAKASGGSLALLAREHESRDLCAQIYLQMGFYEEADPRVKALLVNISDQYLSKQDVLDLADRLQKIGQLMEP